MGGREESGSEDGRKGRFGVLGWAGGRSQGLRMDGRSQGLRMDGREESGSEDGWEESGSEDGWVGGVRV